jgi:hypothetical protein
MFATELAAVYSRDLARLAQEMRAFPDDEALWFTAPGIANAAGTLALHLEGNLREFVGRLLGGVAYARDRPREFSARGVPRDELVARVEAVRDLVVPVVAALAAEALAAPYPQPYEGKTLSTQQFLVHLLAHLGYHLGQIDYLRRIATGDGAIALASF